MGKENKMKNDMRNLWLRLGVAVEFVIAGAF